jgi:hypothetical protein
MMRAIGLLALLAVLDAGAAIAQTGNRGTSPSQSVTGVGAPIGHRQPRATDVPDDEKKWLNGDPNDPLTKENRALDRKLKGICRGC